MSTLELPDGAHLNYETAGDGPTVTFIHPGLWDMRSWDREFASFADAGYRVLRYDVRGYGGSSRPEAGVPYSHVRDLEALLASEEVTQTAIVGCSMGGGIDVDYALEHPERVWGLVLVATGLGGFETTEEEEDLVPHVDPILTPVLPMNHELALGVRTASGSAGDRYSPFE